MGIRVFLHRWRAPALIASNFVGAVVLVSSPVKQSTRHTDVCRGAWSSAGRGVFKLQRNNHGIHGNDERVCGSRDRLTQRRDGGDARGGVARAVQQLLAAAHVVRIIAFFAQVAYIHAHPDIAWDIALLCVTSALGQKFVFLTIEAFSALTLTTITTMRKFITILLSVVWYGNELSLWRWGAIGVVLGGVGIDAFDSERAKRRGPRPHGN